MQAADATLLTCLTPPGRAAIATLAVRGPMAWTITRALFRRRTSKQRDADATGRLPETPMRGKFWLGWLGDQTSGGADEVVLLVKETTPQPWLELHCHGGPEVVRMLLDCFRARGAHEVAWHDFELGATPLWRRAAQNGLAQTWTERTAQILLDQCHGAFLRKLVNILAHREAGEFRVALDQLEQLIARIDLGRHLLTPWNVVIAGAPNVGKSSLVNALAGYQRSIVHAQPGTTRDLVTATVALDGWPVELMDTAGQRDTLEPLEQAGIARAEEAAATADLCLWILDGAAQPVLPSTNADNLLLVINKTDLAPAWHWQTMPDALHVSASTSTGLADLCEAVARRLAPTPPAPGEAVPYTEPQCQALEQIRSALGEGRDEDAFRLLEELHQELTEFV